MRKHWNEEEIREAVAHTTTIKDCLLYMGLDPNRDSNRGTLKRKLDKFNIDYSHFIIKTKNRTFNGETQICSCCNKEKPITEFYARSRKKSGIQSICKECSKQKYNKSRNDHIKEVKLYYLRLLGGECVICKTKVTEDNYVIFDFHHKDPTQKELTISSNLFKDVESEILKCEVLCANCHRLYHHNLKKNNTI